MAQRLQRISVRVQDGGGAVDLLEDVVERVVVDAGWRARLESGWNAA